MFFSFPERLDTASNLTLPHIEPAQAFEFCYQVSTQAPAILKHHVPVFILLYYRADFILTRNRAHASLCRRGAQTVDLLFFEMLAILVELRTASGAPVHVAVQGEWLTVVELRDLKALKRKGILESVKQ